MRTNQRPDLPGSELPADRLLGPVIFFVLGVTLAVLGVRGTPSPTELAPESGVASPAPPSGDRFLLPAGNGERGADWVVAPGAADPAEPVADRVGISIAPAAPAPSLHRGGGGEPDPTAPTGCGAIGMPGRSPATPVQPL